MGRRYLTIASRGYTFKEKKTYTHIHARSILLFGPISQLRLTERQKCIDAGGHEAFFHMDVYQSNVGKLWGREREKNGSREGGSRIKEETAKQKEQQHSGGKV